MRKYLMAILAVIFLIFAVIVIRNGFSIGNFRILSWSELAANNEKLDNDIRNLESLVTVTNPQEQSKLNESYKKLLIKKEDYADKLLYSSESEIAAATQTEVYETEFLWTKIGNYATQNNGIDMKIDVVRGSSGVSNQYNLNFTLIGEYAYISDFISSIENDAKLGFKIERFNMVPSKVSTTTNTNNNSNNNSSNGTNDTNTTTEASSSYLLQTTFTIENVGININSNKTASSTTTTNSSNNTTTTNTITNTTTNNNNTTNTVNTNTVNNTTNNTTSSTQSAIDDIRNSI